jgi:hypothetical protein
MFFFLLSYWIDWNISKEKLASFILSRTVCYKWGKVALLMYLYHCSEQDLEEVLSVQTRLYKCAHLYLGHSRSSRDSLRPFGLLRSLPCTPGGRDKINCDCNGSHYRKILPCPPKSGSSVGASAQKSSNLPSTSTGAGKRQSLKISQALW